MYFGFATGNFYTVFVCLKTHKIKTMPFSIDIEQKIFVVAFKFCSTPSICPFIGSFFIQFCFAILFTESRKEKKATINCILFRLTSTSAIQNRWCVCYFIFFFSSLFLFLLLLLDLFNRHGVRLRSCLSKTSSFSRYGYRFDQDLLLLLFLLCFFVIFFLWMKQLLPTSLTNG